MGDIDDSIKELYKAWADTILGEEGISIDGISDLQDGKLLCALVDILDPAAKLQQKERDNGESCEKRIFEKILNYLKCEGIKTNVSADGLASKDIKQFLDLIWLLILHFTLHSKGTKLHQRTVKLARKNLLHWCSTILPHLQTDIQKSGAENLSDGKFLIELIGKLCNSRSQENCGTSLSDALATAEEDFGIKAQIISVGDFASGKGNEHAVLIYLALLKRKVEQMDNVGPHHRMPDSACNDKEVSVAEGSSEDTQNNGSLNPEERTGLEKQKSTRETETTGSNDDGSKDSMQENPLGDSGKDSWETSDLELELSGMADESECDQTVIYCPESLDSTEGGDSGKSEMLTDPDLIVEKYCKKSGANSRNESPHKDVNANLDNDKGCLSRSEDSVVENHIRADDEDSGVQSECSTVTRKSTESPPMETLRKDTERHDLGGALNSKSGNDSCICIGLEETVLNSSDPVRKGIEEIYSPLRKPPEESFECSTLSLCESPLSAEDATQREQEISDAIRIAVLQVLQSMPRSVSEESIYRSMSSLNQTNMSSSGVSTPFSTVGPPNEDLMNVLNQISQTSATMCKEIKTQQSKAITHTEGLGEDNGSEAGCIVTEEQKSQVIEVLNIEIDDLRVENGKLMQELVTEKNRNDTDSATIQTLNKSISSLKGHVESLEKDKQSMQETVEKFQQIKDGPMMFDVGTVTDSQTRTMAGSQTLSGITIHRGSQTVGKSTSTSYTQYEKACALDIYTQTKALDIGEQSTSTDDLPTQLSEETGLFKSQGFNPDQCFRPLHRSSSISNMSIKSDSLDESFSLQKSTEVIDRIMNQMSQITSIEDAKEIAEAISAELDKKGYESEPECAAKWQRLSMTPVSSDPKVLALQRSLASAMVENEILESKLKKAKKKIQRNTDELTSNLNACRDALKQVQDECEVLKLNHDNEQSEKLALKEEMTDLQKELENARGENEKLTAKLERSMAMVKINLEAPKRAVEYEKENEELKEKLTTVTDLEEENQQLKEKMEHITEEKENITKEYDRLKSDLSQREESSKNLESELSNAESEKNLLQSEVLVLRNEYNFLKKTVTNLEKVTKTKHPDQGAEYIRQARLESFDVFQQKDQQKDIVLPSMDSVAASTIERSEVSPPDGGTIDLLTSESFTSSLAPLKLDTSTLQVSDFDLQASISSKDYSQLDSSTVGENSSTKIDESLNNSKAKSDFSVNPPPLSDGILSSSTLALLKLQPRNRKPVNPDDPREKVHQDIIEMSEQVLSTVEVNGTKTPLAADMIHWEDVRNSIAQRLADTSLVHEADREIEAVKLKGLFQTMEKELGVESLPAVFKPPPMQPTEPVITQSLPATVPDKAQSYVENTDGELSPDMAFQMQELAKTINTELGLKVKILPATPHGSPVSSPKRKSMMERIELDATVREKAKPRPDPNKLSESYEVLRKQRIQMLMKAFTGKDNPENYNPYLTAKLNSGSLNKEEQMMLVEDLKMQKMKSDAEKQESAETKIEESIQIPDSPKPYSKWLRKEKLLNATIKSGSESLEKEQLLTELYRDVFEEKNSKSIGGYMSDTASMRKGKTYETNLRDKSDTSKIRPLSASMDRAKSRKETSTRDNMEYSDSPITSKYRRQIWPHKRNYAPPWLQEDDTTTRGSLRDHSDGYLSDGCILDTLSRSHIRDVLSEDEEDEDKGSTMGETILNKLKENEDSGKEFSAMRHFKSALQTRYGHKDMEFAHSESKGKRDRQYSSDNKDKYLERRENRTPQRSRDSLSLDRSYQRSSDWERSRFDKENMRSYQDEDRSGRDLGDLRGYRSLGLYSDDERGRSQYRKTRDRYKEREYMSDTGSRSAERRSKDRRDGSFDRSWGRGSDREIQRGQGDEVEFDLDITPTNMDALSLSGGEKSRGSYGRNGYYSDMDRRDSSKSRYKERDFGSSESDRILRDSTHKYNQIVNTEDRHERGRYGIHSMKEKNEDHSKPLDINELSNSTNQPKSILKRHERKDKTLAAEVASIMKKYDQHMEVPSSNASSTASSKDFVVTLSGDIQKRSKGDSYKERAGYRQEERISKSQERSRDKTEERTRNRSDISVTLNSEEKVRDRPEISVTSRTEERIRNMTDERRKERAETKSSIWNHSCVPQEYEYKVKDRSNDDKSRIDSKCTDPDCKLRHQSKSTEIDTHSYRNRQQEGKYPRELAQQMEANVDEMNSSWHRHNHNCHNHHDRYLRDTDRHGDDKYSSTHKHEFHHTPWHSEEFWTEPKKYEGDRLKNSGPSCNYDLGSNKTRQNRESVDQHKAEDRGNRRVRDNRIDSSKRGEKENRVKQDFGYKQGSSRSHFEHTVLSRKDMDPRRRPDDGSGFMELTPEYSSSTEHLNHIDKGQQPRDRQRELLDQLYPLDKSDRSNSKSDDFQSSSRKFTSDKRNETNNDHNLALRYEKRYSGIPEQDPSLIYEPNIAVTITRKNGTETITSRGSSQSSVVDGSDNEGYKRGTTARNGTSKKKRSVAPSNKARRSTTTSYQAKTNLKRDRSVAFANPEVSVKKDKSLSTAQQKYANTLIDRYALQWEKEQEVTSGIRHPKYTMPQPRPTEEQKKLAENLINKLEIHWQETDDHQFENLSFTDVSRSEFESSMT